MVRPATPADGPALAAIYRPAVTDSAISFELEPPDAAEMASRVTRVLERTPWLVAERGGSVIGYAYAGPHRERPAYRWSVEVSAYVDQNARRAGVARALYTSLFSLLALQGYRNAYAGITLPNEASVGLHRALGFATVGVYHRVGYKFGRWHDVMWLERALADHSAAPEPPRTFPALLGDEASARDVAIALDQ